jgi:ring-1,2-phenylacetyl-CoA epoxidase subunit PaaD
VIGGASPDGSPNSSPAGEVEAAWEVAAGVLDPELPVLSLLDLGVLRDVEVLDTPAGRSVTVTLTPTYSGCPAMATMRDDLHAVLRDAGYVDVRVRVRLQPAWSTDWISAAGRRKLLSAGISPPGPAPSARSGSVPGARSGPVPLTLIAPIRSVECPQCGSSRTRETSPFGSTACTAVYRCEACAEPFPHVKEL